MSENNNKPTDDLHNLLMAGLGAVMHIKEKSVNWFNEMAEKGKDAAPDVQPMLNDMAAKGKEALTKGGEFGEEAVAKLQKAFDGLKADAKQIDVDDVKQHLTGMTDDALHGVKTHIDGLLNSRTVQDARAAVEKTAVQVKDKAAELRDEAVAVTDKVKDDATVAKDKVVEVIDDNTAPKA